MLDLRRWLCPKTGLGNMTQINCGKLRNILIFSPDFSPIRAVQEQGVSHKNNGYRIYGVREWGLGEIYKRNFHVEK